MRFLSGSCAAWVAGVALAWVLSASGVAAAQTASDEQARTHFQSGRLYFDRGEYENALREFEAAYELSHRPQLLYNIYLTNERLARYGEAAARLEQYLRDDASIDAEQRTTFEARLANLRERAARESEQPTPTPTPSPETPQQSSGDAIGPLGIAGIAALGVGGASLVAFAITGGLALDEDASLAESCGENAGRTCTESQVSNLRTLTTVADVTLAVGLVLAAAGATLLVIDLTDGSGETQAAVAPMVSPTVAGLVVEGRL